MKIDDLKKLLELVSESDIAELELEEEGVKLKIRKATHGSSVLPAHSPVAANDVATSSNEVSPSPVDGEASRDDGLRYVTSPMVGTFYRQAEPGAEPFAREGDTIRTGQVLCIIEAMKLMNEIESDFHGELVKVLVENGQSVQYGDSLFAMRENSAG